MERAKYLDLCKKAAACYDEKETPMVKYLGNDYIPYAYQLKFNEKGNVIHTAVILAENTIIYASLSEVQDAEK